MQERERGEREKDTSVEERKSERYEVLKRERVKDAKCEGEKE